MPKNYRKVCDMRLSQQRFYLILASAKAAGDLQRGSYELQDYVFG